MLDVLFQTRLLEFTKPGVLLPWMGLALRGTVNLPFKEAVCQQPKEEFFTNWKYCTGCKHMSECPFGQTLEPDPPAGANIFKGQEHAARPVVLRLPFPMPPRARPGTRYPLTIISIGKSAIQHVPRLWEHVALAGLDSTGGFGPDHITFELKRGETADERSHIEMPPDGPGKEMILRVKVLFHNPLIIREGDEKGRKHYLLTPTFGDLFRACLRTIGTLFALYDKRLSAPFAELKQAAEQVPTIATEYIRFGQHHYSTRNEQGTEVTGVLGGGLFGPLPAQLLPWLVLGGQLHVGQHRVAGAGGWNVLVDDGRGGWRECA